MPLYVPKSQCAYSKARKLSPVNFSAGKSYQDNCPLSSVCPAGKSIAYFSPLPIKTLLLQHMKKGSLLIIDDEDKFRQLLARIIELEGYTVFQAATAKKGLALLEQENEIDLVLTDVKLPDCNGIDLVQKILARNPVCQVIVMTAFGAIADGVRAMKSGAFDYFTKGNDNDQILPAIERALDKVRLQKRIIDLEVQLDRKFSFETILGKSKLIQETIRLAKKVAPTDSTVLLEGETGVGKELFAQAIHNDSTRKSKAFVAVNCSAFPTDLLESELFGHKRGAFTGALYDKKGLFEEAHEGTLFLDEAGEMNPDLQAKLLRVLETQTFIKIGDSKPTKVNVRIIAATNRVLLKETEEQHFRSDLYYRLSAFKITIPALRERKEDIQELAMHFLKLYSAKIKKRIRDMDNTFLKQLKGAHWTGNIRELKNCIERAVILSETEILSADLLPAELTASLSDETAHSNHLSMATIEKAHILKILNQVQGNKSKASDLLGIGLTTLYRKLEEYKIEKD
jgi:two-component system NtrC family response regulator